VNTGLIIPDLHFPFHHQDTFDFLSYLKERYQPDSVICLGDEVDFHTLSRWTSDPDGFSTGHEYAQALVCLDSLYKLFPIVKTCTSNHTVRPYKKAADAGIPAIMLKGYKELLMAPETWEWADRWVIDDVIYEHGEGLSGQNGAITAARQNMMSTAIGHIHSFAGVTYLASHDRMIFGFNVGCLIDRHKYAFAYGKKLRNKPIIGAGIMRYGIPYFIPMRMDGRERWIGKI
jgi:hypothetical protein